MLKLEKIVADNGYHIIFTYHMDNRYEREVEIKYKPESAKGSVPEKNRIAGRSRGASDDLVSGVDLKRI